MHLLASSLKLSNSALTSHTFSHECQLAPLGKKLKAVQHKEKKTMPAKKAACIRKGSLISKVARHSLVNFSRQDLDRFEY
eukprot:1136337-Pelagomonas_calceolata.AAC.1